ncbi:MAG TPA: PAS domain-containing sensor histidine kinase [Longimicrobium sp.]|nr:PAS domain-containing sensor histidine kinase [Longimicrobium sp.]
MSGGTAAVAMDDLLNQAPCGFLSFVDDGTVTAANQTLLGMLGYEADELTGGPIERIFNVGTRIFYQTHFFPLLRMHGHAEEIFLLLRSRGGQDVGVLCNASRRERGGAPANDCVFMRVQERRKYEEELLRARRAADEARGVVEAQASVLREQNRVLEEQAMELELSQQQLQEQAFEMETASEEMQAINDELLERTDELEHARTAAEEANKAKSTFLAVMSHELRTPLNAIAGYVQLMEMGIHGPVTEAQLEALGRIERSQRHLLRLINDVLNLARIEAGRVDYALEDVPLAEVVATVMPMVEPQLNERQIGWRVEVDPALVVRADRDKVQQIVLNLLSNAVKFTPPGGLVTVDADAEAGRARLHVHDTGIGIPADKVASVFEPFVQVDVSRTRRAEGSGLGLAISRDLARGMAGDLHARSVEGRGSTFTLTLPCV